MEREKDAALKKQEKSVAPRILGLLYFTIRSRRVAATGHHLNDLIVGGCNDQTVLPNRLEMALLAFLGVDATV